MNKNIMFPNLIQKTISPNEIDSFKDDQNREIRVVTNLMSISAEEIANMYKARWGIEVFFLWMKQNLNASTLFGKTKNTVINPLYAALTAYVLIR